MPSGLAVQDLIGIVLGLGLALALTQAVLTGRLKAPLREWLEDESSPKKKRLDIALAVLIVVSIATYVIYLSNLLPSGLDQYLHAFDYCVIGIFATEYLARFYVATDFRTDARRLGFWPAVGAKISWMARPMSVIDALALLPALRIFRIARIFRLFRLLRLVRGRSSFTGIIEIFQEHAFELATVFAFMIAVLVFAGTAMFLLEPAVDSPNPETAPFKTIGDAFWWAIVTMTTVGYGDKIPETGAGRILATIVVIAGVLVIAFPTAIITSAFTEKLARMKEGKLKMERFTDHIVICGLTKSTPLVVREIERWGERSGRAGDIVVISSFAAPGSRAPGSALLKIGDITRESILRDAGLEKASVVIVLGERRTIDTPDETVDARTILCAMQADTINPTATIVVEISEPEHAAMLRTRVPRAEVIESGALGPRLMAVGTFFRGTAAVVAELLTPGGNDLYELPVTETVLQAAPIFGSLFAKLRPKGATPVAVRRERDVTTNPADDYALRLGDSVIAISDKPIEL